MKKLLISIGAILLLLVLFVFGAFYVLFMVAQGDVIIYPDNYFAGDCRVGLYDSKKGNKIIKTIVFSIGTDVLDYRLNDDYLVAFQIPSLSEYESELSMYLAHRELAELDSLVNMIEKMIRIRECYWIVQKRDTTVLGPFSEDEFDEKCKILGINDLKFQKPQNYMRRIYTPLWEWDFSRDSVYRKRAEIDSLKAIGKWSYKHQYPYLYSHKPKEMEEDDED